MNVLLLFPMRDGQTGPAIKHAFEQLGHHVVAVDAKLQPKDSYSASFYSDFDLIFCSRTKELAEEVVKIKKRLPNAKACMWNVDTRYSLNEWGHLFPLIRACDYHFVVAYGLIPEWKEINPNTYWLPQGLRIEKYGKPKEISGPDRARYSCDISFAGDFTSPRHQHRAKFMVAIKQMDVDLKLWGCNGNPKIYNEEHNKMVALSKINLGCSGWPENGKYSSVRNYKILGAGGFLLELYREGIYDIFPSDTIKCYSSPQDLIEKIRYWLDHRKAREEMAKRGYKWVHENATYTHRISQALEYMQ